MGGCLTPPTHTIRTHALPQALWAYANLTLGLFNVSFGRSRSSPAIDGDGNLYGALHPSLPPAPTPTPRFTPTPLPSLLHPLAASDANWFNNDTLPFLLSFTPKGSSFEWNWAASTGQEQVNVLGSANPVVRDGVLNEEEVYIAGYQGAVALTPGKSCVAPEGLECNNNGECNCVTGKCVCNADDVCKLGPYCGNTCNKAGVSTGTCSKSAEGAAVCACSACYAGPTCAESTCGDAGSKSFLATPAGAAAVGVPVALALAVGLYAAMWRAMNPKKAWGQMLACGRSGEGESAKLLASDK